jgi:hypothetical protein
MGAVNRNVIVPGKPIFGLLGGSIWVSVAGLQRTGTPLEGLGRG